MRAVPVVIPPEGSQSWDATHAQIISTGANGTQYISRSSEGICTYFQIMVYEKETIEGDGAAARAHADSAIHLVDVKIDLGDRVMVDWIDIQDLFGFAEACDPGEASYFGKGKSFMRSTSGDDGECIANWYFRLPFHYDTLDIRLKAPSGTDVNCYAYAEGYDAPSGYDLSDLNLYLSYRIDTLGGYDYSEAVCLTTDTSATTLAGELRIAALQVYQDGTHSVPVTYSSGPAKTGNTYLEGQWAKYTGRATPLFTTLKQWAERGQDNIYVDTDLTGWSSVGEGALFVRQHGDHELHRNAVYGCGAGGITITAGDSSFTAPSDTLYQSFVSGSPVAFFGTHTNYDEDAVTAYLGFEDGIFKHQGYYRGVHAYWYAGWPKRASGADQTGDELVGLYGSTGEPLSAYNIWDPFWIVSTSAGDAARHFALYHTQNYTTGDYEAYWWDRVSAWYYAKGAAGPTTLLPTYTYASQTDTFWVDESDMDGAIQDTSCVSWAAVVADDGHSFSEAGTNMQAANFYEEGPKWTCIRPSFCIAISKATVNPRNIVSISLLLTFNTADAGAPGDSLYFYAANFSDPDALGTSDYSAAVDSIGPISYRIAAIVASDVTLNEIHEVPIRGSAVPYLITYAAGSDHLFYIMVLAKAEWDEQSATKDPNVDGDILYDWHIYTWDDETYDPPGVKITHQVVQ